MNFWEQHGQGPLSVYLGTSTASANADLVRGFTEIANKLRETGTKDVRQIAADQLELLGQYHKTVLSHSERSFRWALRVSVLGMLFLIVAIIAAMQSSATLASVIPLASGAIVEVISGTLFVLYGKASAQLSVFHGRLEALQRDLLQKDHSVPKLDFSPR